MYLSRIHQVQKFYKDRPISNSYGGYWTVEKIDTIYKKEYEFVFVPRIKNIQYSISLMPINRDVDLSSTKVYIDEKSMSFGPCNNQYHVSNKTFVLHKKAACKVKLEFEQIDSIVVVLGTYEPRLTP